jgi:hydroxyacylglutathione hydrolase
MAPQIADVVEAELAAGTLIVREGSFAGLTVNGNNMAKVGIRIHHGIETQTAARVINCTGPSASYRNVASPLLQSLFAQGIASAGPLGGTFNTTLTGAMIDANGNAAETIFNLGPGRLGTVIETIAVPEIRQQAHDIAVLITARIATTANPASAKSDTGRPDASSLFHRP